MGVFYKSNGLTLSEQQHFIELTEMLFISYRRNDSYLIAKIATAFI